PHRSLVCSLSAFLRPPPPTSPLFPYTTLFRSRTADHRLARIQSPDEFVAVGLVRRQRSERTLRLGIARRQAGNGQKVRRRRFEHALQRRHLSALSRQKLER